MFTIGYYYSKANLGHYTEEDIKHIVLLLFENQDKIGNITIDLAGAAEGESTLPYYPIYKLQNKPINKLIIYADPNFGITSSRFKIENDSLFLLTQHSQRKLKELDSNYVCEEEQSDIWTYTDFFFEYIPNPPRFIQGIP